MIKISIPIESTVSSLRYPQEVPKPSAPIAMEIGASSEEMPIINRVFLVPYVFGKVGIPAVE